MTDKQIIIDGCDVSGCEFFKAETFEDSRGNIYSYKLCYEITELEDCSSAYECSDKERANCYYKQLKRAEKTMQEIWDRLGKTSDELKRKEQECEELKNFHINLVGVKECEIKELVKLKQTLQEIKDFLEYEFYGENIWVKETILQKISEVENEKTQRF